MNEPEDLRVRWNALAKQFRVLTLPLDLVFSANSYKLVGPNLLPGILDGKRAAAAAAAMAGATPEALAALAEMARVNIERTGDVFKAVAVSYVTLPLAFLALLSDAAPERVRRAAEEADTGVFVLLAWVALAPIAYFLSHWRAKQIGWTIDLYRAGALASKSP